MHHRFQKTLARLLCVVVLAGCGLAFAGGYDLGLSDAELRQARAFAAKLRQDAGIELGLRVLCEERSPEGSRLAAVTVLVERAARFMPQLLEVIAAGEPRGGAAVDRQRRRDEASVRIVEGAVCRGTADYGYGLDVRSEATIERSRVVAQRALIDALGGPTLDVEAL